MKLPVPQRGQPLDVSFVYDIVNSINELWNRVAVNVSAYASLWTVDGRKSVRATEIKFVTGQIPLSKTAVTANSFQDFSYNFDISFKYPPVVTATPISIASATDASKACYAIITEVTPSSVKGVVKFEVAGTVSMAVNIIAVGSPV
ncbi:MAG: hypothetical protein K9J32_09240 [Synechococcus lacustris]|nr:hypothetical protein [Synechococcus lacustris]